MNQQNEYAVHGNIDIEATPYDDLTISREIYTEQCDIIAEIDEAFRSATILINKITMEDIIKHPHLGELVDTMTGIAEVLVSATRQSEGI